MPPIFFYGFCIVFYDCLASSSVVYSTLVFGCAVPRHYFIPYRNDVYPTRFFTGKALVNVPIGDMTDTFFVGEVV